MPKKEASKAEFVRSLPVSMPAKQVVDRAKEAGLELSPAYVYVIRSQARTGGAKGAAKSSGASSNGATTDGPTSGGGPRVSKDVEARLVAVASEIGLSRSIEILTREKARVMRVLR